MQSMRVQQSTIMAPKLSNTGATRKRKREQLSQNKQEESLPSKTSPMKKMKEEASIAVHPPTSLNADQMVWIGAAMQNGDGGAYSIYYGVDDERNTAELCTLSHDQDLNYVYMLGAIRAVEMCRDETVSLTIFTGNSGLHNIITNETDDLIHSDLSQQLKQLISKRLGATNIRYASHRSVTVERQVAHQLANAHLQKEAKKPTGNPACEISNKEATKGHSKEDQSDANEEQERIDAMEGVTEGLEVAAGIEETVGDEGSGVHDKNSPDVRGSQEGAVGKSWASMLGLRNILAVLKAPFAARKIHPQSL
ncbi:uncharacterized protein BYT42DRAFT_564479 [Radiomyces spectabilis]|uniref:uncharacterized protein n=1 Tax=Radiomyces spectabilis TaxID=64574 RepID=UPI00221E4A2A|nr:uncharacterized protein BYT42DRAFT_564479 [Radiomyces spectabilis]KAI8385039.1 hypothetical protein BYT42DRAFT_564479 [Radiomyces spectabilis]